MDYKVTFNKMDSAMNAAKLMNLQRESFRLALDGKCKKAREIQREIAKLAVNDFEAYKALPSVNITVDRRFVTVKEYFGMWFNSLKFRIYSAFTRKTPEEKIFIEKSKSYAKTLSPEDIKKKTINVQVPLWSQYI